MLLLDDLNFQCLFLVGHQVFTLWGITDTALGGLGFGSDYIGFAQASSGIALVSSTKSSLWGPIDTSQLTEINLPTQKVPKWIPKTLPKPYTPKKPLIKFQCITFTLMWTCPVHPFSFFKLLECNPYLPLSMIDFMVWPKQGLIKRIVGACPTHWYLRRLRPRK